MRRAGASPRRARTRSASPSSYAMIPNLRCDAVRYGPAVIRQRLAGWLTEAFAPAVLVSVLLVLLGVHSEPGLGRGLAMGALAALFESVLPYLYILRGV